MNPKVSIIIPIYNTEKYLKKCLDSILNQSYQNLEIVLVDDGSTDNSSKIADDYAKKNKRILVIHQKNAGQSTARNNGIKKPDYIKELLSAFTSNTSLSVCGMHYKRLKTKTAEDVYIKQIRSRRKNESKKAYILYLLTTDGRMYSSVNKLYKADIVKILQFDKTLNFAEDTKFVLEYLEKATGEIAFVNKPLYIYNFGTETSTVNSTAVSWDNWKKAYTILKKWLGSHPSAKEKFWLEAVYSRWHISYIRSKRRAKQ